jgi:7,8-dihydropterin-6-yl-methyl-4-(beta-D-ribofuranosyl)aminobenzene 5'-phosphate synthase
MDGITIKLIYDNCCEDRRLQAGWGFSCLIQMSKHTILFDTGDDTGAFFSNAEKMDVNLDEITEVVFSHKHDDHTTGSYEILEKLQETVQIYVPKGFPLQKIPPYLQVETVVNFTQIDKEIFSMVLRGGLFLFEQVLVLNREKGLVVITGCAHPGIVTILKTVQKKFQKPIHFVLGGFHLFKKSDRVIEKIVSEFQFLKVEKVAPCHCSGSRTSYLFQEAFQDSFCKIGTGSILNIR